MHLEGPEVHFALWDALSVDEWPLLERLIMDHYYDVPPFFSMACREKPPRHLEVGGKSRADVDEFLRQAYELYGFEDDNVATVTVAIETTNKAMYITMEIECSGTDDTVFKAEWRTPGGGVDDVMAVEEFAEVTEDVDEDLLAEDPTSTPTRGSKNSSTRSTLR